MFQRLFLQAYQLGCFHRKSGELLLLSFSLVLIWIRIGRLVFADGKYKKAKNWHVFYVQLKAFFINVYNSLTVHALIYQADQKAFPESPLKASPFSWTPSTTDCPCCHLSSWPGCLPWVDPEGESIFPQPLELYHWLSMLSSIKLTRIPSLSHPWRWVHFSSTLRTIPLTVHAVIYQADQKAFSESPLKASPFFLNP
jgi:hypothetical protein